MYLEARVSPSRLNHAVVVIGAGAFGGWTALELRRRGARVTLIDAWGPGHARASSGGETRIIRATYGDARGLHEDGAARARAVASARPRAPAAARDRRAVDVRRRRQLRARVGARCSRDHGARLDRSRARRRVTAIPPDRLRRRPLGVLRAGGRVSVRAARVRIGRRTVGGRGRGVPALRRRRASRCRGGAALVSCVSRTARRSRPMSSCSRAAPGCHRVFPDVIGANITATRQEVYYFGTPAGDARFSGARAARVDGLCGRLPIGSDLRHPGLRFVRLQSRRRCPGAADRSDER